MVHQICEANLARTFTDGLQWMESIISKLKLKGAYKGGHTLEDEEAFKEELLNSIDVRVVDYYHTFGALIDREQN